MANWKLNEYKGAMSALFTPYGKDGKVNVAMIEKLINFQLKEGLTGFYVTGSTGEGFLLSDDERRLVMESAVKFTAGRAKVIAHVGHISTDRAVELAKYAAKCGVDMLSSTGPVYYGQSFEGAVRHYTAIAGATDLPFITYSIGTTIVPERDIKLMDIKNVVGMKYTGMDFYSMQRYMQMVDKESVFFSGFDEEFVASLSFGFHGGIGTTYNIAPGHFARIYKLYKENNVHEAARVQEEINKVITVMVSSENRSYQKGLMRYIGYDCGAFRAPFAPLTEEQYQAYAKKIDALKILKRND